MANLHIYYLPLTVLKCIDNAKSSTAKSSIVVEMSDSILSSFLVYLERGRKCTLRQLI